MFGFGRKPKWSLQFWNPSTKKHYALESNSIGELIGYLATDLENGMRPSAQWVVQLVHRNLQRLEITHDWPESSNPVVSMIAASTGIDGKLERTGRPPKFYEIHNAKRYELPLYSSVSGKSLISMSLEERIQLAQSGSDADATAGFFDIMKQVFTEKFGVPSATAGEVVYSKIDPQWRPNPLK